VRNTVYFSFNNKHRDT